MIGIDREFISHYRPCWSIHLFDCFHTQKVKNCIHKYIYKDNIATVII